MPDRATALRQLKLSDVPRAVFFGYDLPYKGIETLEEAAATLGAHGIEVLIAGGNAKDADTKPSSRQQRAPSNYVQRLGLVSEADIPSLFAVMDVLVLPYRVGLATSGPMALAVEYQIPVVVSDVLPLAELLDFPQATFPRGDAKALAQTVLSVISDEGVNLALRNRLAVLGAQSSWGRVAELTVHAYAEASISQPIRGTRHG